MAHDLARIDVSDDGDQIRIVLAGEVDASNADEVETRVRAAARPPDRVVIDLGGLTFIDSQGVRVLVDLALQHQPLRVIAPAGSPARRVLELTDLISHVRLVDPGARLPGAAPTDGDS
jgi:anti-sigma B factor antagonist